MNKRHQQTVLLALLFAQASLATWLSPSLTAVLSLGVLGLTAIIARVSAWPLLASLAAGTGLFTAAITATASPAISLAILATAAPIMRSQRHHPLVWSTLAVAAAALAITLPFNPFRLTTLELNWHTWLGLGLCAGLMLFALAERQQLRARLEQAISQRRSESLQSNALVKEFSAYLPLQATRALKSGKTRTQILHRRRNLVVFFSDIHEFTDRVEEMEPEDVALFLNEYLTDMCRIAKDHGGLVDKFIGDSLMITFGDDADSSPADNAERCIHMALEMQRHIRVFSEHWSDRSRTSQLQVRMGISAGYCTTGNFGSPDRLEYTAIGKQVNLAARLEAMAAPGQILCSYPLWKLLHQSFFFEPAGEIDVKGFARPVSVFAAQGAAPTPSLGFTDATDAAPAPQKMPSNDRD